MFLIMVDQRALENVSLATSFAGYIAASLDVHVAGSEKHNCGQVDLRHRLTVMAMIFEN